RVSSIAGRSPPGPCEQCSQPFMPRTLGHVICAHCGNVFEPRRRSARFCGPACRVAAHRKIDRNANEAAKTPLERPTASPNRLRAHCRRLASKDAPAATRPLSVTRAAIVADPKWPNMFRLKRTDGTLSDMVNLTRAKDALAAMQGR